MDIIVNDKKRKMGITMENLEHLTLLDLIRSWFSIRKIKKVIDEIHEEEKYYE